MVVYWKSTILGKQQKVYAYICSIKLVVNWNVPNKIKLGK